MPCAGGQAVAAPQCTADRDEGVAWFRDRVDLASTVRATLLRWQRQTVEIAVIQRQIQTAIYSDPFFEVIAPDRLEPAYLRDKVALTLAEQRQARGG